LSGNISDTGKQNAASVVEISDKLVVIFADTDAKLVSCFLCVTLIFFIVL
jgi:hypothetical protein